MGKKFCPQCNMNVSVVRRKGKKCCPCCGFDADYMGPAVSEQYSSTRPPSQNQTLVKPDVHDESDRTFEQYSTYSQEPSNTVDDQTVVKAAAICAIILSFVLSVIATYISEYTWTSEYNAEFTGTVYGMFADRGIGFFIPLLTAASVAFVVFIPRYLGLIYAFIGLVAMMPGQSMSIDSSMGFYALLVSLAVGYLINKWEKMACNGRMNPLAFYRAFWKNGKF